MTHVPFVDLRAQSRELHDELSEVFESVLSRAAYTMGPELGEFEAAFAAFCGAQFCAGVSSGTDALRLALQAAGVGPGDEVVVPVNTFMASAEAVSHCGATPVFVDCLPDTANLDPSLLAGAITPRTKAILPVHLYGQPADMDAIGEVAARHGLAVVEDACQAHGAAYKGRPCGSLGVSAAFSFYPGKNLGALGDGGAVVTSDAAADRSVRLLRNHGEETKSVHEVVGYCNRLHNLQAGFLLAKLAHLTEWNNARRAAARRYDDLVAAVSGATPLGCRDDVQHVYHLYVVQVEGRDAVRERLGAEGVQTGIHYPVPLHLQPAYKHLGYGPGDFPVAEAMAARILSLPMFPELTPQQQEYVVEQFAAATAGGAAA
ncbi:MAG: DegT/DnrJ/EryC1/StrS family aminotransferase [Actinobacteria bacterium]|nr:DegT/DnrJ/EryC1/StrS family aminotransferase [Actinomycetota bacterium]